MISAFEYELRKLITAEIERLKEILAEGSLPARFSDYRFLTGQVFALRRVLDAYLDEANDLMNKR